MISGKAAFVLVKQAVNEGGKELLKNPLFTYTAIVFL